MTKTNNTVSVWNFIWLIAALVFALLIFRVIAFNLVDKDTIKYDLLILPLSIWFILFAFQFKAMRKKYVFICWFIVALLLLAMKIWITEHTDFAIADTDNTNYKQGLLIPLLVLLFYQFCRQVSLKYYNNEISMPTKVFNFIPDENRKANGLERIHAIGMFAIPVITLYV